MAYTTNQVANLTINGPQQPGNLYALNGALNAYDVNGAQTIKNGKVPFPGTIILAAFTVTSVSFKGWLPCNGGEYSCTDYADLYAAIGNTFGSSNQGVTFKVPNISNLTTGVQYIIKT